MTLVASGTLEAGAKVQYFCTIVHGEALRQFDSLSADVGSGNPLTVDISIKLLALYFFPVNLLAKQKARCVAE